MSINHPKPELTSSIAQPVIDPVTELFFQRFFERMALALPSTNSAGRRFDAITKAVVDEYHTPVGTPPETPNLSERLAITRR